MAKIMTKLNMRNQTFVRILLRESIKNSKIETNLSEGIILTTKDKLRLSLLNYKDSMEKTLNWPTRLEGFLTLLLSIATTGFKDTFGIKAESWFIFFVIILLWNFLRLAFSVYLATKLKAHIDIEHVVSRISKIK